MTKYETTHTAFLGIDLDLLENPKYSDMDVRATMLYALYKDRAHLSLYTYKELGINKYIDKYGVFIIFTNELAAKILHVSEGTIGKFRKQLSDHDLIKVRRNGLKGYKIYVNEVQKTPKNVSLLMPWKNHYVEIKKEYSDWTIAAQIKHWNDVSLASKFGVFHEGEVNKDTCPQNTSTSICPSSLKTININNNGLVDNAHARTENQNQISYTKKQSKQENPYHSLPDKIKQSFVKTFGFITRPVALELHTLISQSNVDMVNYVVENAYGHKITSPIAYVKAAIANAVKRGAKCVQDMIDYYENNVKKATPRPHRSRYMSEKEVEEQVARDEAELKEKDPTLWERIQKIKEQTRLKKLNQPMIPMYHLGE